MRHTSPHTHFARTRQQTHTPVPSPKTDSPQVSLANEAYELIDEYMKQLDNDILRLEDEVACVFVHVCVCV